jgi:hypothetical protein
MIVRGTLEIRLTVAPNGVVKIAQLVNSVTKNETVKLCLFQKIKGWQFPASADGKDTEVTVDLLIRS